MKISFFTPLNSALNAAIYKLDTDTIICALLHNVHLDEQLLRGEKVRDIVRREFGENVVKMLDEYQELSDALSATETDFKIVTRYILSSADDVRLVILKLCEVLDNVRTFEFIPESKKEKKIEKILDIYSPLAEYLNLFPIKKEIEEVAFEASKPEHFHSINKKLLEAGVNEKVMKELRLKLYDVVCEMGMDCKVFGRIKSKYSIYNKLKKYESEGKGTSLRLIKDLIAFSVVLHDEQSCFEAVSLMQKKLLIDEKDYDDYISRPKPNGYSAIHMVVMDPSISDLEFEVQVLTQEMYYRNTYGPASHIAYKASKSRYAKASDDYDWVENIHKGITEHINKRETERSIPIKSEVFRNSTFVFTPKGKIVELDKGATVLDFAYRIHSDIGNSAVGAKIGGRNVKLSEELKTGDVVEVMVQRGGKPSEKWLGVVKTGEARRQIRRGLGG